MRSSVIWLLILSCLASFSEKGHSQNIDFEALSVEDGLSQNTVRCILQDSKGLIWLGTEYGLNCYDGYSFHTYKNIIGDSTSLHDNQITALHEDRRGNIWVGTQNGLHRFIEAQKAFKRYLHNPLNDLSLSDNRITSIQSTATGILWIATQGSGLNKLDIESEQFRYFLHDPLDNKSIGDNHLYTLATAGDNSLWIGHKKGFDRLNAITGVFEHYKPSVGGGGVIAIETEGDLLWLGTNTGLLSYQLPEATFKVYTPDAQVSDIHLAKDGALWIGSAEGLWRRKKNQGSFELFQHYAADRNSLSSSNVKSLAEDGSGIIWIGTYGGGVNKFLPSRQLFGHFRHIAGNSKTLTNNDVTAIAVDQQQQIWIGTSNGLDLFNISKERIAHYDGSWLSNPYITALAVDSLANELWIGTRKGLNCLSLSSGKVKQYYTDANKPNSLSNSHIYSLLIDKERNTLWVGTGSGLNRFNPETQDFQRFMSEPDNPIGLGGSIITSLIKSNNGMLWVGTYDAGFFKFNPITEIFKSYKDINKERTVGTNGVMSLYESPNGELWIGTFDGGLNRYSPSKNLLSIYTEEDGLPNNQVYGILPDGKGGLWCSTNNKLGYFNMVTETFRVYDIKDGLQGNEFSPNAYAIGYEGELIFGGPNGFNIFNPELIKDNEYSPNVLITQFELFNKPVVEYGKGPLKQAISETEHIVLSHSQHTFSFEFASLSYQLPERNQYAYMLEGLDTEWQYIGKRRKAYFTGVGTGTYTFKVKATNSDGVWNKQAASIKITIETPIWQTWWFISLVVLVIALGVYFIYDSYQKRISKKMHQLYRMLEKSRSEVQAKVVAAQVQGQKLRTSQGELSKHKDLLLNSEQQLRKQERELRENMAYASKIQQSLLISEARVHEHLPESFISYLPKQQVGGDFYWLSDTSAYFTASGELEQNTSTKTVIAVGDCAGKGISSALLSMVAVQMLNEIVNLQGLKNTKKILDVLNHNFGKTLNYRQGNQFYGLDLALVSIDWEKKIMGFSGAMRPLIYIQRGELKVIRGEGFPIGVETNLDEPKAGFLKHEIDFSVPTTIYLLTDGFEDQLGGEEHRKYMLRRIKELLLNIHDLPMETQKTHIEREFLEWKGSEIQIDDFSIIGFRIPRKSPKTYQL